MADLGSSIHQQLLTWALLQLTADAPLRPSDARAREAAAGGDTDVTVSPCAATGDSASPSSLILALRLLLATKRRALISPQPN